MFDRKGLRLWPSVFGGVLGYAKGGALAVFEQFGTADPRQAWQRQTRMVLEFSNAVYDVGFGRAWRRGQPALPYKVIHMSGWKGMPLANLYRHLYPLGGALASLSSRGWLWKFGVHQIRDFIERPPAFGVLP